MKMQRGFTLIEALATGMISSVLGGAILSTLYMTNTQTQDGINSLILAKYQVAVSSEIRRCARLGGEVKKIGDLSGHLPPDSLANGQINGLKTIYFCDTAGVIKSGFQVDGANFLREWNAGSFIPFMFGSDTVKVDYATSNFTILPRRRGVEFRLKYSRTIAGTTYDLPVRNESVICRSQTR